MLISFKVKLLAKYSCMQELLFNLEVIGIFQKEDQFVDGTGRCGFFVAYMPLNICNVGIFGTCCFESSLVLACFLLYLLLCDSLSFLFMWNLNMNTTTGVSFVMYVSAPQKLSGVYIMILQFRSLHTHYIFCGVLMKFGKNISLLIFRKEV